MFVTWLTSCEEARHQAGYSQSVIAALPDTDDATWGTYISPQPSSTLKQRAQGLWGIRVAFTHGDGELSLISNTTNRTYAGASPNYLPGVNTTVNPLLFAATTRILHNLVLFSAIKPTKKIK